MGFTSAKKSNEYEKGDLLFPSKEVYELIKSIDSFLRLLYNGDWRNHSNVRNDEKYLSEILGSVEDRIGRIKMIGDWLFNDLYKEKYEFSFMEKFRGIHKCYKEYQSLIEKYGCMEFEFGNSFERRIVDIKLGLGYIGVDFYED